MHSPPPRLRVNVEFCKSCDTHTWCTHHDQQKYLNTFKKLKKYLENQFQNQVIVQGNSLPQQLIPIKPNQNKYYNQKTNKYVQFPVIGAFQITIDGQLVFSKKKTNTWPNLSDIGDKVHLKIYGTERPHKSVDSKKSPSKEKNNYLTKNQQRTTLSVEGDIRTQKDNLSENNKSFLDNNDKRSTFYKPKPNYKNFTLTDHFKNYHNRDYKHPINSNRDSQQFFTSNPTDNDQQNGSSQISSFRYQQGSERQFLEFKKNFDIWTKKQNKSKLSQLLKRKGQMKQDDLGGKKQMIIRLDSIQQESILFDENGLASTHQKQNSQAPANYFNNTHSSFKSKQKENTHKQIMRKFSDDFDQLQEKFKNFQQRVENIREQNKKFDYNRDKKYLNRQSMPKIMNEKIFRQIKQTNKKERKLKSSQAKDLKEDESLEQQDMANNPIIFAKRKLKNIEDYINGTQEEKNEKLKKIYGQWKLFKKPYKGKNYISPYRMDLLNRIGTGQTSEKNPRRKKDQIQHFKEEESSQDSSLASSDVRQIQLKQTKVTHPSSKIPRMPPMPPGKSPKAQQTMTQQKFYTRDQIQQVGTKKLPKKSSQFNTRSSEQLRMTHNQFHRAADGIKINTVDQIRQIQSRPQQKWSDKNEVEPKVFVRSKQKVIKNGRILRSIEKTQGQSRLTALKSSSKARKISKSQKNLTQFPLKPTEQFKHQQKQPGRAQKDEFITSGQSHDSQKLSKNFRSKKNQNANKSKEKKPEQNVQKLHKKFNEFNQNQQSQENISCEESYDHSQSLQNNYFQENPSQKLKNVEKGSRVKKGYEKDIGQNKEWKQGKIGSKEKKISNQIQDRKSNSKSKENENKWKKSPQFVQKSYQQSYTQENYEEINRSSSFIAFQKKLEKKSKHQRDKDLEKQKSKRNKTQSDEKLQEQIKEQKLNAKNEERNKKKKEKKNETIIELKDLDHSENQSKQQLSNEEQHIEQGTQDRQIQDNQEQIESEQNISENESEKHDIKTIPKASTTKKQNKIKKKQNLKSKTDSQQNVVLEDHVQKTTNENKTKRKIRQKPTQKPKDQQKMQKQNNDNARQIGKAIKVQDKKVKKETVVDKEKNTIKNHKIKNLEHQQEQSEEQSEELDINSEQNQSQKQQSQETIDNFTETQQRQNENRNKVGKQQKIKEKGKNQQEVKLKKEQKVQKSKMKKNKKLRQVKANQSKDKQIKKQNNRAEQSMSQNELSSSQRQQSDQDLSQSEDRQKSQRINEQKPQVEVKMKKPSKPNKTTSKVESKPKQIQTNNKEQQQISTLSDQMQNDSQDQQSQEDQNQQIQQSNDIQESQIKQSVKKQKVKKQNIDISKNQQIKNLNKNITQKTQQGKLQANQRQQVNKESSEQSQQQNSEQEQQLSQSDNDTNMESKKQLPSQQKKVELKKNNNKRQKSNKTQNQTKQNAQENNLSQQHQSKEKIEKQNKKMQKNQLQQNREESYNQKEPNESKNDEKVENEEFKNESVEEKQQMPIQKLDEVSIQKTEKLQIQQRKNKQNEEVSKKSKNPQKQETSRSLLGVQGQTQRLNTARSIRSKNKIIGIYNANNKDSQEDQNQGQLAGFKTEEKDEKPKQQAKQQDKNDKVQTQTFPMQQTTDQISRKPSLQQEHQQEQTLSEKKDNQEVSVTDNVGHQENNPTKVKQSQQIKIQVSQQKKKPEYRDIGIQISNQSAPLHPEHKIKQAQEKSEENKQIMSAEKQAHQQTVLIENKQRQNNVQSSNIKQVEQNQVKIEPTCIENNENLQDKQLKNESLAQSSQPTQMQQSPSKSIIQKLSFQPPQQPQLEFQKQQKQAQTQRKQTNQQNNTESLQENEVDRMESQVQVNDDKQNQDQQSSEQNQQQNIKIIRAPITKQFYGQSFNQQLKIFPSFLNKLIPINNFTSLQNFQQTIPQRSMVQKLPSNLLNNHSCLFNQKSIEVHKLISNHPLPNVMKCLKILADINEFLIIRLFENPSMKITQKNISNRIFGVWLCVNYEWKCVIIDLNQILLTSENDNEFAKPYYLSHSNNQLWPIILETALAKALKSYKFLTTLPCHKIFNILTGSNSLFFNIKQDPTKNSRILRYITDCQNKNFILHAEKVCKNLEELQKSEKETKIYYVLSQKIVNQNQILLQIRESIRPDSQWMKLTKFAQEFKSIQILQLRLNHNFSSVKLPKPMNTSNLTIIQLEYLQESFGSITLSTSGGELCLLLKTYLYKQEKSNVLKLVGQAKQKNKATLFFDCFFTQTRYYLFVESSVQSRVTYLGENQPLIRIVEEINSDGLKNDFTEYLPIKTINTNQPKIGVKESGESSMGFKMPNRLNKSRFGETGLSFKSQQDQKISRLRENFVEYLLKGKD